MTKYINPYTDFGFKKLFGEPANADLLIDFLNTLLPEKHQIETLKFRDKESLGAAASDRRAVFDIYCENSKEEPFIVEMQKAEQEFFKDRSLYYTSHPVREQGIKGKWDFELKPVYFNGILDFMYEKGVDKPVLVREVSLKDQFGQEFYEKLKWIYIQMPVFDLEESQLKTRRDKWFYFLKNLPDLNHIPAIMKEEVFQKAFHTAEVAAMAPKERRIYEQDLNDYWTYLSSIETAEKKGEAKGIELTARNMKKEGFDPAIIVKITGLSPDEIKRLPLDDSR
jgi:predicted transposase/invertase (TIGR01784 family)